MATSTEGYLDMGQYPKTQGLQVRSLSGRFSVTVSPGYFYRPYRPVPGDTFFFFPVNK